MLVVRKRLYQASLKAGGFYDDGVISSSNCQEGGVSDIRGGGSLSDRLIVVGGERMGSGCCMTGTGDGGGSRYITARGNSSQSISSGFQAGNGEIIISW